MTFIAAHCQSDQIVKRGKTARGTQRYLCQNTLCTKGSSCSTLATAGACLKLSTRYWLCQPLCLWTGGVNMAISTFETLPNGAWL